MLVDPKFQFLEEKVVSTTLNTIGARDHILELEIQIKFIKERVQAHHSNLHLPTFTRRMTIELAKYVVTFLKALPPNIGLSKKQSKRTIMMGKSLD